jgi:hypothetical protein
MMESLPEGVQGRVAEHLRDYIQDLQEELQWDISFQKTQYQLIAATRKARQQIAESQTEPIDYDRL